MYAGNLKKLHSILSRQTLSRTSVTQPKDSNPHSAATQKEVARNQSARASASSAATQKVSSVRSHPPLQQEVVRLAKREKVLNRLLNSQIQNSLDFNTILQTAINEIRQLLRVECCQFLWHHPDRGSSLEGQDRGLSAFEPIRQICQLKKVCSGCISPKTSVLELLGDELLERKLLRIDNTTSALHLKGVSRDALQARGIESLLAVTFRTRSEELGVIVCEHRKQKHTWRDDEVELLTDLADRLAIALDHARLYEQSRIAAEIAQAQAQKMQQTLEELASTQTQLIQTEKMSSLGLLVAGVAHEINNPINFIHGNLSYAQQYIEGILSLLELYQKNYPQPSAEIQQLSEKIELDFLREDLPQLFSSMAMGTHRIQEIVRSLRNFSRIDETKIQPADLHKGLDSTLLILQNQLPANARRPEIELIKEYGDLPLVDCLAGQLNQVFMNLICNAIDALEEGIQHGQTLTSHCTLHPFPFKAESIQNPKSNRSARGSAALMSPNLGGTSLPLDLEIQNRVTPQIKIRTEVLQGDRVAISIIDNGPGMSEDVRSRLFDPFFTTKPVGKGTGLGLSIAYQIVEKHKGKLECISSPGEGAEFRIVIPVVQQRAPLRGFRRDLVPRANSRDRQTTDVSPICVNCNERSSCAIAPSQCQQVPVAVAG